MSIPHWTEVFSDARYRNGAITALINRCRDLGKYLGDALGESATVVALRDAADALEATRKIPLNSEMVLEVIELRRQIAEYDQRCLSDNQQAERILQLEEQLAIEIHERDKYKSRAEARLQRLDEWAQLITQKDGRIYELAGDVSRLKGEALTANESRAIAEMQADSIDKLLQKEKAEVGRLARDSLDLSKRIGQLSRAGDVLAHCLTHNQHSSELSAWWSTRGGNCSVCNPPAEGAKCACLPGRCAEREGYTIPWTCRGRS
jgi:hypothetical protein